MTGRDWCGAIAFLGFAAVGLRALRRALAPEAWDALLFRGVVVGLVLASAFADQIDTAVRARVVVAGTP